MLRNTLSNIRKVCAFSFIPRIWRGHIIKSNITKFQKLPTHVTTASKSSKSSDTDKCDKCEKCKRIIDYAFGNGEYPAGDIKGFTSPLESELSHIVTPQVHNRPQNAEKLLDKVKGKEHEQVKEPLTDSTIARAKVKTKLQEGVEEIPNIIQKISVAKATVRATTTKHNEEELVQKIETIDEPSLVTTACNPEDDLQSQKPKALTGKPLSLTSKPLDTKATINVMRNLLSRSTDSLNRKGTQTLSRINEETKKSEAAEKKAESDQLLKDIEKFGVAQPLAKSIDNSPNTNVSMKESEILGFAQSEKTDQQQASILSSKTFTTPETSLGQNVPRAEKNNSAQFVNKSYKIHEWWEDQRDFDFGYNSKPRDEPVHIFKPIKSETPTEYILNKNPESDLYPLLSNKNTETKDKIIIQITPAPEKETKPVSPWINNPKIENTISQENPLASDSKVEKHVSPGILSQANTASPSLVVSEPPTDELEINKNTKPLDPIKEVTCNTAYKFPCETASIDSTSMEGLKQRALDRLYHTNLSPKLPKYDDAEDKTTNLKLEHPLSPVESLHLESYGRKSTYTESVPYEVSTDFREMENKPEKITPSTSTNAAQWASPAQTGQSYQGMPNWGGSQTTDPFTWDKKAVENWNQQQQEWLATQQQLERARWAWSTPNNPNNPQTSLENAGDVTQSPNSPKNDGSKTITSSLHTTTAQYIEKIKPLESGTVTIPKVLKQETSKDVNSKMSLEPIVEEAEKSAKEVAEIPTKSLPDSEKKILSKNASVTDNPNKPALMSAEQVLETGTRTSAVLQPEEHVIDKPETKGNHTEILPVPKDSIKLEVETLSQIVRKPIKENIKPSSSDSTYDPDIIEKTYSAPTNEKIQNNLPAAVGPLPLFRSEKDMPLSLLLKTIRLRNRLESYKAFLEATQLDSLGMSKCPPSAPPCPPPAPKCPPADPCKKKEKKPVCPPKCPPPPVCPPPPKCPPPKPKCPPPSKPACPPPRKPPCPPPKKDPCKCIATDNIDFSITSYEPPKTFLQSLPALVFTLNDNGISKDAQTCTEDLLQNRNNTTSGRKVMLARGFEPWTPIPSWPVENNPRKRILLCPKDGCPIQHPPKDGDFCKPKQKPCKGFPKRATFTGVDALPDISLFNLNIPH